MFLPCKQKEPARGHPDDEEGNGMNRSRILIAAAAAAASATFLVAASATAPAGPVPAGPSAQRRFRPRPAAALLEKLLRVPPQVQVLQISSHNKTGANGDANWPLYKDSRGDDVIFDSAGPGCVRSMWGTAFDPAAVLQFYFDGEKEPRLRLNILDFYKGRDPLFPPPLVSYEKRGMWGDEPLAGNSFVPIPFEKRLKISVKGESRFFHIVYETYPAGLQRRRQAAAALRPERPASGGPGLREREVRGDMARPERQRGPALGRIGLRHRARLQPRQELARDRARPGDLGRPEPLLGFLL
jgi:hypothetical protein